MSESRAGKKILRGFLEETLARTDLDERLANDPIGLVRVWEDPADREVVALIAASLAYGRVELVRRAVAQAVSYLGQSPASSLAERPPESWFAPTAAFVYRMTRGPDLADLFAGMGQTLREHGSLQGAYTYGSGAHLERASSFVHTLRAGRVRAELSRGLRYLLPDPADGSTTKRLHMFFRWVGRGPDAIDLGLWTAIDRRELVMPLDTHTSRICRYLGLTRRATTDLKAALEVTASLRELCPEDPLRYDFALAHLGISGRCIHRRSPEHCPSCPLERVCTL